MGVRATNYSVILLVLMAFTVAMMVVRAKKPLEDNWPFIYWIAMAIISQWWPDQPWNPGILLAGAALGLLLRFEFMNVAFTRILQAFEFGVWGYVLYVAFAKVAA